MDAKPDSVSRLQHFENEAATVGHVVRDLPGAIWSGVAEDFKAHPVARTIEAAAAAAVTAAVYIGTRRASTITRDASAASGVGVGVIQAVPLWQQAGNIYDGTKSLLSEGWNASDDASREKIGQKYASAIGNDVAPFAEMSFGAAVGAASGHALLSKAGPNSWFTKTLTEKAEYKWRQHGRVTEDNLLTKSGSFTSGSTFMNADGTANLIRVDEAIGAGRRTVWNRALRSVDPDIEEGRVVDLAGNRVSAPVRGARHSLEYGFKPENMSFHTHSPVDGPRPSISDVARLGGVQMLGSGDDLAVFLGQTGKYSNVPKELSIDAIFEQRGVPTLHALIVNRKEETARIIQATAERNAQLTAGEPFENTWQWSRSVPRYVDYKASTDLLARAHVNDPTAFSDSLKRLAETGPEPRVDIIREIKDMEKLGGFSF